MSESLLTRVADGDMSAVQACIDRYGGLVWSLARRFCPSRADAEDAVQEIFIELWRKADRFDPAIGAEDTFIAVVARRRLIDRQRRFGRQREFATDPHTIVEPEFAQPEPLETSEDARRAAEALTTLNEQQQRVIKLSVYYGMTHEQIANHTRLPLGTVKTNIRRGLMKIRDVLGSGAAAPLEATS